LVTNGFRIKPGDFALALVKLTELNAAITFGKSIGN
jgi:hypothetical protein